MGSGSSGDCQNTTLSRTLTRGSSILYFNDKFAISMHTYLRFTTAFTGHPLFAPRPPTPMLSRPGVSHPARPARGVGVLRTRGRSEPSPTRRRRHRRVGLPPAVGDPLNGSPLPEPPGCGFRGARGVRLLPPRDPHTCPPGARVSRTAGLLGVAPSPHPPFTRSGGSGSSSRHPPGVAYAGMAV
jgi:hypothetical protein